MRARWVVMLGLAACSGGEKTLDDLGDGTPDTAAGPPQFDDFIDLADAPDISGDAACFTPAGNWEDTTWLTQDVAPGASGTLSGLVEDFESGDAVDVPATVQLWFTDDANGPSDASASTDVSGIVAFDAVPTCQTMTYKVTTDPLLDETRTTYKAHQVYSPAGGDGAIPAATFLSVSSTTYQLIPSILGVTIDDDKAVIAGTAFDCTRDPSLPTADDSGKIEGAQVIVYDENGEIPPSLTVNYFVDDFPNRDQKHTSKDGLWVASNVPAGNLRVEMWAKVGGAVTLLGATQILSEAGSINIANIFTGYGDGVKFPTVCE